MPIIVLFSELSGRTVGRSSNLRTEFIFFFLRPLVTQITCLNVELAKLLINIQILHIHIALHNETPAFFGYKLQRLQFTLCHRIGVRNPEP